MLRDKNFIYRVMGYVSQFRILDCNLCLFYESKFSSNPGGGGNSLYFVWYRRAAGIAPIFQVIYTSIGHDFISNIHL